MNASGWIQLAVYVAALVALRKPLGVYLLQVLDSDTARRQPFLDPVPATLERLCYKVLRVDPTREQTWKVYAMAMLVFSAVSMLVTYGILRLQDSLPLNPQGLPKVGDALAFNTAASFTTNT